MTSRQRLDRARTERSDRRCRTSTSHALTFVYDGRMEIREAAIAMEAALHAHDG
jgi:hypothetical protein